MSNQPAIKNEWLPANDFEDMMKFAEGKTVASSAVESILERGAYNAERDCFVTRFSDGTAVAMKMWEMRMVNSNGWNGADFWVYAPFAGTRGDAWDQLCAQYGGH